MVEKSKSKFITPKQAGRMGAPVVETKYEAVIVPFVPNTYVLTTNL